MRRVRVARDVPAAPLHDFVAATRGAPTARECEQPGARGRGNARPSQHTKKIQGEKS